MEKEMDTLNENIKSLRNQLGINQVELAKRLNVSKQCVSNWENDNIQPSVDMLIKIADFFKVSTDYLLGRESKKQIDVTGITDEQCAHIRLLVKDIALANEKSSTKV